MHLLQRYKLMLFYYYYYYWNSYSLIILLHVHIHKIIYYMSWLTYTLRRPYLQLKHNTNTVSYSRTKELCAPMNNLFTLRQQSLVL